MDIFELTLSIIMIALFLMQSTFVMCNYIRFRSTVRLMKSQEEEVTLYNENILIFFILIVIINVALIATYIYLNHSTVVAVCEFVLAATSTLIYEIFAVGKSSFYSRYHRIFYKDIKEITKSGLSGGVIILNDNKKIHIPRLYSNKFLVEALKKAIPDIIG